MKPPLDVKTILVCGVRSMHTAPRSRSALQALDDEPDGDMISSCPAALRSMRRSGFATQIANRSRSPIGATSVKSRVNGSTSDMVFRGVIDIDTKAGRYITSDALIGSDRGMAAKTDLDDSAGSCLSCKANTITHTSRFSPRWAVSSKGYRREPTFEN